MVVVDPKHPWADFRNFLADLWAFLGLPEPTPVQYAMAAFLQTAYAADGNILAPDQDLPTDGQRKIIEAYRGCGKSFVTSAFVIWCFYWNQQIKIMIVSGSGDRAEAFTQFCLKVISDWEPVRHLYPRTNQRKSTKNFDVNGAKTDHSPSLKSVGITGQLTGTRADIIIGDDVETKTNCLTQGMREKLLTLTSEFENVIKPLPTSQIIYLGTPHVQDTLYNHRASSGYNLQIYPVRVPDHTYEGNLAPLIMEMMEELPVGAPTDPLRFNEDVLTRKEAREGKSNFLMQFMLNTKLEDALRFPLKCSDFIVMDTDRELAPVKVAYSSDKNARIDLDCVGLKGDRWYSPLYVANDYEEYTASTMYIDPSGRGKDRTGYSVVKFLHGYLYVTRTGSLEGGYDTKTLQTLAHIAKSESVNEITIEVNFGDGMFTELFKPILNGIYPCTIEDDRVGVMQKELRIIDSMEPLLNQHRVVINKKSIIADMALPIEHQVFYQLSRITRDRKSLKHDDGLDALAGAIKRIQHLVGVNVEDTEKTLHEMKFDQQLKDFLKKCGQEVPNDNWCDNI